MDGRRAAWILLALYVFALALIALWPEPVDRDAGPILRVIRSVFPVLTHARVEILANVVLFVPFGALLAIALRRSGYLVLPIVFVTSAAIEAVQTLLPLRTTSYIDILANTVGGCVGLLVIAAIRGWRGSPRRATPTAPGRPPIHPDGCR